MQLYVPSLSSKVKEIIPEAQRVVSQMKIAKPKVPTPTKPRLTISTTLPVKEAPRVPTPLTATLTQEGIKPPPPPPKLGVAGLAKEPTQLPLAIRGAKRTGYAKEVLKVLK